MSWYRTCLIRPGGFVREAMHDRPVWCRPLSHRYTAGTTSVILIVCFSAASSANGLIASFIPRAFAASFGSHHITVWPVNHHSGEPSSSHRHPHDRGAFARLWTPTDQAYAAMDLHHGFPRGEEQREFLPLCNPEQPSASGCRQGFRALNSESRNPARPLFLMGCA